MIVVRAVFFVDELEVSAAQRSSWPGSGYQPPNNSTSIAKLILVAAARMRARPASDLGRIELARVAKVNRRRHKPPAIDEQPAANGEQLLVNLIRPPRRRVRRLHKMLQRPLAIIASKLPTIPLAS